LLLSFIVVLLAFASVRWSFPVSCLMRVSG
jgi:hypothetical protein